MFFEWQDSYLTGVSRLDGHHLKLVALINNLYTDALGETDTGRKQPLIGKTLEELIDYSYYHFAAEEDLMLTYEYPGYMPHKEEHDQFKLEVKNMIRKHQAGNLAWVLPILSYLKDWLIIHVVNTDKQYEAYFSKRDIAEF